MPPTTNDVFLRDPVADSLSLIQVQPQNTVYEPSLVYPQSLLEQNSSVVYEPSLIYSGFLSPQAQPSTIDFDGTNYIIYTQPGVLPNVPSLPPPGLGQTPITIRFVELNQSASAKSVPDNTGAGFILIALGIFTFITLINNKTKGKKCA